MKSKNFKNLAADESQRAIPLAKVNLNGTVYVPEVVQETQGKRRPGRPAKNGASTQHPQQQQQETMKNLIEQLFAKVADLEKEVELLKNQAAGPSQSSQVQRSTLVNVMAKEQREREIRAKNVVIRGLSFPDETNLTDQAATAVTKTVQKFVARVTTDSATSVNVSKVHYLPQPRLQNQANNLPISHSAIVVLENEEQQRTLLRVARHHNLEEYKGVFAHEDRTKAQQTQHRESVSEAKTKNDELAKRGLLNKPFRYVVRVDGVRCIDVDQSAEKKKSIYCSPPSNTTNGYDINRFANVNSRRGANTKGVERADMLGQSSSKHTKQ